MGVSPLRLAAALAFGGMVTGGMYLTQHANGRTLPAVAAPAQPTSRPAAVPAPKQASAPQAEVAVKTAPKRIVLKHQEPGEVVLTVHGDELQVQFVPAPKPAAKAPVAKAPAAKPAFKAPAKISALPAKTTPVATP